MRTFYLFKTEDNHKFPGQHRTKVVDFIVVNWTDAYINTVLNAQITQIVQ